MAFVPEGTAGPGLMRPHLGRSTAEFPSLFWLDGDPIEAVRGVRALVADVVHDMEASLEPVPVPLTDRPYSGRFQVRTTPEVRRRLATGTAEARANLNRWVNAKLTAG